VQEPIFSQLKVNGVAASKMKLKLFISQLANVDIIQFPNLKELIECAADNGVLGKWPEKIKLWTH